MLKKSVIFLAIDNSNRAQPVKKLLESNSSNDLKKEKPRNTVTLQKADVNQLKTALRLARNCLQCAGLGEQIKNEALDELLKSQKKINSLSQTLH